MMKWRIVGILLMIAALLAAGFLVWLFLQATAGVIV